MRMIVAVTALLLAACDWFENPSPEQARLQIQGDTGKVVRLIVSTEFVAAVNEQNQTRVVLFRADTLFTKLPFERVYNIESDQRFFAEMARLDTDVENIHMLIYVDRSKKFEEGGLLIPDRPYRFVYTFNQTFTREISVL